TGRESAARDQRLLGRREGVRGVAVEEDGEALQTPERGGKGGRRACRHVDRLLVGLDGLTGTGELQPHLDLQRGLDGHLAQEDRGRERVRPEPVGPLSGAWQRL